MAYNIQRLNDRLVFIKWESTPPLESPAGPQFVEDLRKILNDADQQQYFISDLRQGHLENITVLRRLGKLAESHPQWGGSVSFTDDVIASLSADMFSKLLSNSAPQDPSFDSPQKALAYLETIQPNITQGIDSQTLTA